MSNNEKAMRDAFETAAELITWKGYAPASCIKDFFEAGYQASATHHEQRIKELVEALEAISIWDKGGNVIGLNLDVMPRITSVLTKHQGDTP